MGAGILARDAGSRIEPERETAAVAGTAPSGHACTPLCVRACVRASACKHHPHCSNSSKRSRLAAATKSRSHAKVDVLSEIKAGTFLRIFCDSVWRNS